MTYHEYFISKKIEQHDFPFYALIMAAMRKADDVNITKLKLMWPDVHEELYRRYHAPGGFLEGEKKKEEGE